jgi:hypothetical protein
MGHRGIGVSEFQHLLVMKLHDFLVENAKFPFPHLDRRHFEDTTDISEYEVGLLQREWKAEHAVRDDTLAQKLCETLKNILGDTPLSADGENYLPSRFSPKLQVDELSIEDKAWTTNSGKRTVRFPSFHSEEIGLTLQLESDVIAQRIFPSCAHVFCGI